MTHNDDSSLRVLVSGMMKRPVRRSGKGGIIDEDNLSRFFNDAGCKVVGVRLVVDAKRDKIRGFGFVDFNDYKSLDLALKLHNKEAKGLAGKDGKLRIERASAAADESRKRQRELSEARSQTEEMERELALYEARLNELVCEMKLKCAGQNMVQAHELQLQEEKRRQAALRHAMETIKDAAQRIHTAIEVEEQRAMVTKATVISVHGEQTQQRKDESSVCEDSFATSTFFPQDDLGPLAVTSDPSQHNGATQGTCVITALHSAPFELPRKEPAHKATSKPHPDAAESTADDQVDVAIEDDLPLQAEQAKVRVRNTFIELWVPESEAPPLRRTRTAPSEVLPAFANQRSTHHAAKAV